eukprot:355101-Chlamydomonas_euryale.AAC.9
MAYAHIPGNKKSFSTESTAETITALFRGSAAGLAGEFSENSADKWSASVRSSGAGSPSAVPHERYEGLQAQGCAVRPRIREWCLKKVGCLPLHFTPACRPRLSLGTLPAAVPYRTVPYLHTVRTVGGGGATGRTVQPCASLQIPSHACVAAFYCVMDSHAHVGKPCESNAEHKSVVPTDESLPSFSLLSCVSPSSVHASTSNSDCGTGVVATLR